MAANPHRGGIGGQSFGFRPIRNLLSAQLSQTLHLLRLLSERTQALHNFRRLLTEVLLVICLSCLPGALQVSVQGFLVVQIVGQRRVDLFQAQGTCILVVKPFRRLTCQVRFQNPLHRNARSFEPNPLAVVKLFELEIIFQLHGTALLQGYCLSWSTSASTRSGVTLPRCSSLTSTHGAPSHTPMHSANSRVI